MDRCVDCDVCFLGVVGFDTSGLHGLIRQTLIYTDAHNYTQMNTSKPCLHEETLEFLIQKCVYSIVPMCHKLRAVVLSASTTEGFLQVS